MNAWKSFRKILKCKAPETDPFGVPESSSKKLIYGLFNTDRLFPVLKIRTYL